MGSLGLVITNATLVATHFRLQCTIHKERASNKHHTDIKMKKYITTYVIRHRNKLLLCFEEFLRSTGYHHLGYALGDINFFVDTCTIDPDDGDYVHG